MRSFFLQIFKCSLFPAVHCVRLLHLGVPSFRFRGDDAALKCRYDLEGEQLYSVKWYKDGHEIFR